jgi:hypothetical protein
MSWASRRWERRGGLPAGAGHYSGGGRTVNTRFAPGVPAPPSFARPDAAELEGVFALGEGLVLNAQGLGLGRGVLEGAVGVAIEFRFAVVTRRGDRARRR